MNSNSTIAKDSAPKGGLYQTYAFLGPESDCDSNSSDDLLEFVSSNNLPKTETSKNSTEQLPTKIQQPQTTKSLPVKSPEKLINEIDTKILNQSIKLNGLDLKLFNQERSIAPKKKNNKEKNEMQNFKFIDEKLKIKALTLMGKGIISYFLQKNSAKHPKVLINSVYSFTLDEFPTHTLLEDSLDFPHEDMVKLKGNYNNISDILSGKYKEDKIEIEAETEEKNAPEQNKIELENENIFDDVDDNIDLFSKPLEKRDQPGDPIQHSSEFKPKEFQTKIDQKIEEKNIELLQSHLQESNNDYYMECFPMMQEGKLGEKTGVKSKQQPGKFPEGSKKHHGNEKKKKPKIN